MALEVQQLGVTVDSSTTILNFNSPMLNATSPTSGEVRVEAAIPSGTDSPVGIITATHAGQLYNQIASDRRIQWVSTAPSNTDWIPIGGADIQKTFDPNERPAFAGQVWQTVTFDSAGNISINKVWRGVAPNGNADTSSWVQIY
ncbi:MAG: hypothetical protein QNJ46_15480 [Leptolyngbyaceae cyanobacterium MO_188.B28]|nr:hypothetical protein [Leptolyngbyaceae cyanobacterium MO_188.B28]